MLDQPGPGRSVGHTPGPWVIIPARPYDGDDEALEGSYEAFAGIEGSDGNPVCVFGDAAGSGTMFENEADHRLISTAPELLEALQGVVSDRHGHALGCDCPWCKARAAISKALGTGGSE